MDWPRRHLVPVLDGKPQRFAAVFLIRLGDGRYEVYASGDPARYVRDVLQPRYGVRHVENAAWAPDLGLAKRVVKEYRARPIPPPSRWWAVHRAAERIGIKLLSHDQYLTLLKPRHDVEVDLRLKYLGFL